MYHWFDHIYILPLIPALYFRRAVNIGAASVSDCRGKRSAHERKFGSTLFALQIWSRITILMICSDLKMSPEQETRCVDEIIRARSPTAEIFGICLISLISSLPCYNAFHQVQTPTHVICHASSSVKIDLCFELSPLQTQIFCAHV